MPLRTIVVVAVATIPLVAGLALLGDAVRRIVQQKRRRDQVRHS